MEKNSCISGRQLVAILLASRLAPSLTSVPTIHQTSHSVDFMLSTVLQIGLLFLLYLPVWWFGRRTHGASTIDYAYILFGKGGTVVAALYAAVCLCIQMVSLLRFNHFVSTALSPDMPQTILCIVLVAGAFLAALHGLQAIARAASLIALTLVAALVFVCVALLPEMKLANFPPLLYDGWSPVISGALEELPRTMEIVAVGMLFPYVKGNMTKSYGWWTVATAAAVILIQVPVAGVLGDYGEVVLFPYYTAVTAAQIGVIQRVDIIATTVWIAALFIKMAFFAMLYMSCMQRLFGENKKLLYASAGAVIILVVGLLWGNSPLFQEKTVIWLLSAIAMGLLAVGLPLFLVAADALRNKRLRHHKEAKT